MREFDKIYVAKYDGVLNYRQLGEDLNTNSKEIVSIISQLKQSGLYEIYKNMSEYEWDELDNKTDEKILSIYLPKTNGFYKKIFNEILNEFKKDIVNEIEKFELYTRKKDKVDFNYFYEGNLENEEWKQIYNLNYEISNYGRVKNIQTQKIKALKHQKFGMQILLWQNSKSYTITISRLVAEMFVRHLEKNERAIHINGNTRDNYYKNLRIVKKGSEINEL